MTTFADDFNRANSTDLGANWVEVSGDWSIVSNQLSPGAAGGTIILRAAGAMTSSDHSAQVTIAATTAASQGVWCRGNTNISQGYLLRNNGTSWDLFSVVGGSFTVIGTYTAAAAPGDVAKVQAVGTTIKGIINGVERISVTNSAVTTGTSVGIRSDSAGAVKYDDFSAGDVTAGATLGIASSTETAQSLTGAKASTLGTATETGGAQGLTGSKASALGIAGASESAQPLAGSKAATLAAAVETAAAQPLVGAKSAGLTPAVEQDAAQVVAGGKAAAVGVAGSTESAQPLTGAKAAALAPAVEQDSAQGLGGVKAGTLGVAVSVEAAQPLAGFVPDVLGTATAVEAALPLVGSKAAVFGTAVEADAARPLVPPSTVVPAPERTFRIPAERRRLVVVAERRSFAVAAESRTLTVR
ncbi:hypothetical protein AB0M61_01400 [Streptomyces sp. NPDC051642]|uniref:hypothetical protein n=1 Tax=Streptomyces sp. NPDC051642 TaxID=3154646 RepID=UPI00341CACCE